MVYDKVDYEKVWRNIMSDKLKVGILGGTGMVGQRFISLLENHPWFEVVTVAASPRSAGKTYEEAVGGRWKMDTPMPEGVKNLVVMNVNEVEKVAATVDFVFSAVDMSKDEIKAIEEAYAKTETPVVSNNSAHRWTPDVPMVVPEINPEAAFNHPRNIIANPNCTTIITLMALFPLHQRFGLKTVIASSYQAVSGSGQHGIAELETQVRAVVDGHPVVKNVYPHQIAFNLLPQIDSFTENGYTKEELKMLNEGRKILSLPELKVTCTCVRVPVYRSHSISVTAQFEKPVDLETARSAYEGKPGVALMDNPAEGVWPTPLDSTNGDTCYVGRMRMDMAIDNALTLWVVGDQVRKGAALNAVQIAELLVNR